MPYLIMQRKTGNGTGFGTDANTIMLLKNGDFTDQSSNQTVKPMIMDRFHSSQYVDSGALLGAQNSNLYSAGSNANLVSGELRESTPTVTSFIRKGNCSLANNLSGDFDIRYKAKLNSYSGSAIFYGFFLLLEQGGGGGQYFSRVAPDSGTINRAYFTGGSYPETAVSVAGMGDAGNDVWIRLVRSGGNVTQQYRVDSSGSWITTNTVSSWGTGDVNVQFSVLEANNGAIDASMDEIFVNGTSVGLAPTPGPAITTGTGSFNHFLTYAEADTNANMGFTGDFTIEANIKTTTTGWVNIMSCGDGAGWGATTGLKWQLTMYSGGVVRLQYYDGGVQTIIGTTPVNDGSGHHIAIQRTGSTLQLRVDGGVDNSATFTGTFGVTSGQFVRIGMSSEDTFESPFDGYLEEIRFSNVARY